MNQINITLDDYKNAPEGSLLIKKSGKWCPTSFRELNKENESKLSKIPSLETRINNVAESAKHFNVYAKSHFMVAFNFVMAKVLIGTVSVNEDFINLGDKVLKDEISVKDAIETNADLKSAFSKLYLSKDGVVEFSEV